MSALVPGSLETQTREPLDGKYWVQNFSTINTGLTFQGLLRFSKTDDKLYIKLNNGWEEILPASRINSTFSLAVGNVTSGNTAKVTNVGTGSNPILDFVLPRGLTGNPATIVIDRVEPSPDSNVYIENVGTVTDARLVFKFPVGGGVGGSGFDRYDVPLNIREFVVLGTYNSSQELTTTGIPVGSISGMSFGYQMYDYEYKPGDDGITVWTRNRRLSFATGGASLVHILSGNEDDKAPSVKAVNDGLSSKADIASPILTGNPQAPYPSFLPTTPSIIATQGYVLNRVTALATAIINGTKQIFLTYADAEGAVQEGAEITLYGYHVMINVNKSVDIRGGIIGSLAVGFHASGAITSTIYGSTILTSALTCSSTSVSSGQNDYSFHVVFDSIQTTPNTYFGQYSLTTATQNVNYVTLRNINLSNRVAYQGPSSGVYFDGAVQFQERPENASSIWTIKDCILNTKFNSSIVGLIHHDTRVILEGNTRLEYPSNLTRTKVKEVANSTYTDEADFLIDNRLDSTIIDAPYILSLIDNSNSNVQTSLLNNKLVFNYSGGGNPTVPDAPLNPIVDDTNNLFSVDLVPTYSLISNYQVSIDNGATYVVPTSIATIANGRISFAVGNYDLPIGYVRIRVGSTGLYTSNPTAFTQLVVTPNVRVKHICYGNSLTRGGNITGSGETGDNSYPFQLFGICPAGDVVVNLGNNGATIANLSSWVNSQVLPELDFVNFAENRVYLMEFTNTLPLLGPADTLTAYFNLVNQIQALDSRIIIGGFTGTPIASGEGSNGFNSQMAAINASLRSFLLTDTPAKYLFNLDSSADFSPSTIAQNPSIYPDGVHLKHRSYEIIAHTVLAGRNAPPGIINATYVPGNIVVPYTDNITGVTGTSSTLDPIDNTKYQVLSGTVSYYQPRNCVLGTGQQPDPSMRISYTNGIQLPYGIGGGFDGIEMQFYKDGSTLVKTYLTLEGTMMYEDVTTDGLNHSVTIVRPYLRTVTQGGYNAGDVNGDYLIYIGGTVWS